MFRTVSVTTGEKISLKDNWMVVTSPEGTNSIPISDIYSVMIDNPQCMVTVPVINALTGAGAHIMVCDARHQPASVILPQSIHYRPLNVVRRQIAWTNEEKDALWDRVVAAKIKNQAEVLKLCDGDRSYVKRITELAEEVQNGDEGNREGIAAKMFFRELYGSSFIRMADDTINAALNYGYTIIRSAFCKTLVAYGYFPTIGIHHINESNPFNLADDLMEPLRPIVDMWVSDNHENLIDELTRQQRNELCALVNALVLCDGKKMRVRNAIDKYVSSFTSAVEHGSPKYLKIPTIIRENLFDEEDESD